MRSRVGLTVAIMVVLGVVVVIVIGVGRRPPVTEEPTVADLETTEQASSDEAVSELQDLTVEGAEVTQKDADGNIIWRVTTAGRFDFDHKTQILRADEIRFELMRPGQATLIVEAPEFLGSYRDRTLRFSEGVTAYTTDESQFFRMAEVVYQIDTRKLIAEGEVRFCYRGYEATAHRLVIDNRAREVRMSGGGCFSRVAGECSG